ncbi:hypothetical protein BFP97_01605 [Roseivirga sp. 4D4]|uniref:hypothetical protein n=1 Tax=Roseivirga sp. 4D4 TaxID=1889784 RepID=UPI000852F26F|nr:hypothetical protein [Roseivirga sp. 4D4]OEK00286.1 hypothetical protein BFP97_01605 [Roseivirga sp. 4D4]
MSKKHKWIFLGMIAIPFAIALGFRAFDNYQFHQKIITNREQQPDKSFTPSDDDCIHFLLTFGESLDKLKSKL